MEPTIFPTKADIDQAAGIIRSGGLVAFPTETVYGLGANALDARCCPANLCREGPACDESADCSCGLHGNGEIDRYGLAGASGFARAASSGQDRLTLVLPKRNIIPDDVTAGLPTVGVRMPSHPVALQLIESAGVPLAAPSANRFTKLSPTEAQHVREGLG